MPVRQQSNIFAPAATFPRCEIEAPVSKMNGHPKNKKRVGGDRKGGTWHSSFGNGQGPWQPAVGRPPQRPRLLWTPQWGEMARKLYGALRGVGLGVLSWRALPAPPATIRGVAESLSGTAWSRCYRPSVQFHALSATCCASFTLLVLQAAPGPLAMQTEQRIQPICAQLPACTDLSKFFSALWDERRTDLCAVASVLGKDHAAVEALLPKAGAGDEQACKDKEPGDQHARHAAALRTRPSEQVKHNYYHYESNMHGFSSKPARRSGV